LAGTLTLPEGNGPFPALLLLSGSGPQDRNEELFGHRPFLVIADALTRAGFAVLRADDRGVGASEGDFDAASFEDFAEDALAGLHYLTSHPEVDAARVGLLGHSEGGFIAPVVASASAEVAFLITLAGPSVRGAEVLELQNKLLFEQAGATEAQVEAQLAYLRELAALIEAGDTEAAKARTRARMEESFADLPEEERPTLQEQAFLTEAQVASLEAGWFQDFLSFDPAPYLRTLTVPLLAIYGERDLQVPPEQSEGPLRELMREANNEDATIVVFDGLNHLMQPAQTGGIEEYGVIETTIAPEVLELLAGWLSERFKDP
jgi:pimeloyl-ACP methyl ester carboxylesterase